jgi:hypothetical protein
MGSYKIYLETTTDRYTKQMTDRWKDRLGASDIFLDNIYISEVQIHAEVLFHNVYRFP